MSKKERLSILYGKRADLLRQLCQQLWRLRLLGALMMALSFLLGSVPEKSIFALAQADQTVYLPIIFNRNGPDPTRFQIAFIDDRGAWLISSTGARKLLLTRDTQVNELDDLNTLHVAPDGRHIAVQQTDGWAIYARDSQPIADKIAPGFSLAWEPDAESLLLSKLGHGIDRFVIANQERLPLLQTTNETNDHSPLWRDDGNALVFAHQEFGTQLYVTLLPNFDETKMPYMGEDRDSDQLNEQLILLDHVESWHDQPVIFHWANDQRGLIYAAKTTIHVRSLVDEQHATIQPAGFGLRETGRAVDVYDDRILYFAGDGIYEVGLDGENARRIVEGDDLHYPQWGPRGERVVYRGTDDQLYMVNADGSNNHVIPNTTSVRQFDLLP